MLAVDFGEQHKSCPEAMVWRRSLGTAATQSDAYLACHRGDWLLWQLERLPREQYEELRPAIQRVREKIVERAIRRALASIEGVDEPWVEAWRLWADRWLSGEDRSMPSVSASPSAEWATWSASRAVSASAAAAAASRSAWASARWASRSAWAATRAEEAESRLQAEGIRAEIPAWPGK